MNLVNEKVSRWAIVFDCLRFGIRFPHLIKESLRELHVAGHQQTSAIPILPLEEIVDAKSPIVLQDFALRKGNLHCLYELSVICSLVAHFKPKHVLEIGTFDGNTTLQLALNAPDDAKIHTLDLLDHAITNKPTAVNDLPYIQDQKKHIRKFASTRVQHKIIQHFGDSTAFDFSIFGELDFIFIDG